MSIPSEEGEHKRCKKCGDRKPLTEFWRASAMRDGYRNECKCCGRTVRRKHYEANRDTYIRKAQEWKRRNPERYAAQQFLRRQARDRSQIRLERDQYLQRTYGLSLPEFEFLVAVQTGRCAICGKDDGNRLHVDHDHSSGRVRGLLCDSCNRAMGLFHEDPARFEAAGRYLRRPQLPLGSGDKVRRPTRKVRAAKRSSLCDGLS